MGCVIYFVLINGSSSKNFSASRGLKQGCMLSPLLFILVMEGLSRLLLEEKQVGSIRGIQNSKILYISHLLFVDDVLLMGTGTVADEGLSTDVYFSFVRPLVWRLISINPHSITRMLGLIFLLKFSHFSHCSPQRWKRYLNALVSILNLIIITKKIGCG